MKKQLTNRGYLLGKDEEGTMVYLQKPSWDCGWYWGFGYVQGYAPRKMDISFHMHFNELFLKKDLHKSFKEFFKETTLNDKEVWTLLELMKTFYALRQSAEVFGRGGSHITKNPISELIKDGKMVDTINKTMLPLLFNQVDILLTENE